MTLYGACLVLLLCFNLIYCQNSTDHDPISNATNESSSHVKTSIPKCCPEGKIVKGFRKFCIDYPSDKLDFSDLEIYDADVTRIVSTVKDRMQLIPAKFENDTFKNHSTDVNIWGSFDRFITEDGILYLESPNSYNRWTRIEPSGYCVDYSYRVLEEPSPHIWIFTNKGTLPSSTIIILIYAKLGACAFLLLVLIVYPMIRRNRNVGGVINLFFTFSLLKTFTILGVMSMLLVKAEDCYAITYSIYFSYMATFCWMTVMAFDLFSSIRHCMQKGPNTRMKAGARVFMYCLYSWGVASILTSGLSTMNSADLHYIPWFIQPNISKHGCFLSGGEKAIYLFVPAFILLLICVIIYSVTIKSIRRITRTTLSPNKDVQVTLAEIQTLKIRFNVNIAVLAATFVHCLLELVKTFKPTTEIICITYSYNILFCPLLFFILIFYAKILRKKNLRRPEVEDTIEYTPTNATYTMTVRSGPSIRRVQRPPQTQTLLNVPLHDSP